MNDFDSKLFHKIILKKKQLILFNFTLVNSKSDVIEHLDEFWNLIFNFYNFISIKLYNKRCEIIIGTIFKDSEIKNINLEKLIMEIKMISVKNLPNNFELQLINYPVYLKNKQPHKLLRKYFAFSDLSINSSFMKTLIALMEFKGLEFFITQEKTNKNHAHNISFCISSENYSEIDIIQSKVIEFLKFNPTTVGSLNIISDSQIKKEPGRVMMGFNKYDIPIDIIFKVVHSISGIVSSISNTLKQFVNIYPWLGFTNDFASNNESSTCVINKESIGKKDINNSIIIGFKSILDRMSYQIVKVDEIQSSIVAKIDNFTYIFYLFIKLPITPPTTLLVNISNSEFETLHFVIHSSDYIPINWEKINLDIIHIDHIKVMTSKNNKKNQLILKS